VHIYDPNAGRKQRHEPQTDPALQRQRAHQPLVVAILFLLAGLSGLALFHPALFWLSHLFGGGPWTRICTVHRRGDVRVLPRLVLRFWRANFITANDRLWLRRASTG
jgi:cytochrome b subunit of formate dehydrogenase